MNADRLLELYEQTSEAPDATARLRRFVLDLAVRGKLVEQDPTDEPASILLQKLVEKRKRLVSKTEMRAPKRLPTENKDAHPFPEPRGWCWTVANDLWDFENGDRSKNYPSRDQLVETGIPFINAGHLQDGLVSMEQMNFITPQKYKGLGGGKVQTGDQLYCLRGSLGKHAQYLHEYPAAIASSLVILRPVAPETVPFLSMYFNSGLANEMLRRFDNGTAQPNLSAANLRKFGIPLPPLAEQRRIVAKVDELMALCDRLEEARKAREETRDRLTASTLARLTAPETTEQDFPAHARFALDTLPALTARPDQIKTLRQTILNLAVRGKLVEQDPGDEPLPLFDKGLPRDLLPPFPIPANWQWSRLRALGSLKGGGTPSKARDDFWNGDIPWVSPKDMKVDYIDRAKLAITKAAIAGSAVNLIEPASILFVVRGMILAHTFPVAISKVPVTINQDMKAIIPKKPGIAEYLLRALNGLAPQMLMLVQRSSHGTCRLEGGSYGDFLVPLPPLAEQHRIVAKVDALMALCDRLEAALAQTDSTRTRLLEALLHEALEPANQTLEAAE